MPKTREQLHQKAGETILLWKGREIDETVAENLAIDIVGTLFPDIGRGEQLLGVPEGSLVISHTRPHPTVYMWRGGELVEAAYGITFDPDDVIGDEGELTVVWMP